MNLSLCSHAKTGKAFDIGTWNLKLYVVFSSLF